MTLFFLLMIAVTIYYFFITKGENIFKATSDTTKRCSNCHNPVKEDFNVCPICKETLKKKCEKCGEKVETSWKYCPYCEEPTDGSGGR
ncbi:MAG: zinc ribbon domain-containing protein [Clostridia bacterium]|nr:zinc ribbon domain-containing protein [Clostridia bacterium]